jgi:hypothetical protein
MDAAGSACRGVVLGLALLLGAATQAPPPDPGTVAARQDRAARLTIPVMVNGQGPYDFLIDTAADRSVISRELAASLSLRAGPEVKLHSTGGIETEPSAIIDRLAFGTHELRGITAPALSRAGMGAAGILGLDSLRGQLVVMDFAAGRFLTRPSEARPEERGPFTVVVEGRRRFGQLVLVDADSARSPILVILDSGAQNSIGNPALRRLLETEPPHGARPNLAEIISVTGSRTPAHLNFIAELHLGGVRLQHVPIAYADLHSFETFGLRDRPAMLLGMDVLHLFARVTVDIPRREAVFVAE